MKKIFPFIIFLLASSTNPSFAQDNSLEFSSFNYSTVPFSFSQQPEVGAAFGLNYVKSIHPNLDVLVGGTFLKNIFDDSRKNCVDCQAGYLAYRQGTAFLGARYWLRKNSQNRWNYFTELNVQYFDIKANGTYEGGFHGGRNITNLTAKGYGVDNKVGVRFNISKRLYANTNAQLFFGRADVKRLEQYSPLGSNRESRELVWKQGFEFRLGYRF